MEILLNGILNYNKIYREYITNYLSDIDQFDDSKKDDVYKELLEEFKSQKDYKTIIHTMYVTSLMVNYTTYKLYKDDQTVKKDFDYINSFKSIDEVIKNMNINLFKMLCSDVITFETADYFIKKRYVKDSYELKNDSLKNFLYIIDCTDHDYKLDTSFITNSLHYDNGDEIGTVEKKAITSYSSDQLIKLEENDPDNYKELLKEIIDIYYRYNTYKQSDGENLDNETKEIMKMIEDDSIYTYSVNNKPLLSNLISNFIEYKLLYPFEKEDVDSYRKPDKMFDKKRINNKNDDIREKVIDIYSEIDDLITEEEQEEAKSTIYEELLSCDNLNDIEKIMYNDSMSIICGCYYRHIPHDIQKDYDILMSLNNFDEFKKMVETNEYLFFIYLRYVQEMYYKPLLDKKDMILTLIENKSYNKFLIHPFIPDVLAAGVDYDLADLVDLYDAEFASSDNKEKASYKAVYKACADIEDLWFISPDNQKRLIEKILKIYYMYIKFLIFHGTANDNSKKTIEQMENNLDEFIDKFKCDYDIKWEVLCFYYEYVSLEDYEKDNVKKYYNDIDNKGKIKIFSQKNKNSN